MKPHLGSFGNGLECRFSECRFSEAAFRRPPFGMSTFRNSMRPDRLFPKRIFRTNRHLFETGEAQVRPWQTVSRHFARRGSSRLPIISHPDEFCKYIHTKNSDVTRSLQNTPKSVLFRRLSLFVNQSSFNWENLVIFIFPETLAIISILWYDNTIRNTKKFHF